MLQVTVTLTFDLLTPKLIGIIYASWPSMIQRKVRPNKNICLVPVTCPPKIGRVGRDFFFFYFSFYYFIFTDAE